MKTLSRKLALGLLFAVSCSDAARPGVAGSGGGAGGGNGGGAAGPMGLGVGDVPATVPRTRPISADCQAAIPGYGPGGMTVVSTKPHTDGYPEASLDLPDVGKRVADPDFKTCLVRATPRGWMNGYSRFSAFNADASKLLVRKDGGEWFVLAADQLGEPMLAVGAAGDDAAARWHGTDPNVLFYLQDRRLMRRDLRMPAATVAFDPTAKALASCQLSSLSVGGSEGEASAGSRFWGFFAETTGGCLGGQNHFVTVDLETGDTFQHTLPSGVEPPDNSSMSVTGKYFVANYQVTPCNDGRKGTFQSPCGLMAYPRSLDSAKMVHPAPGHHDEALSKEGHDLAVVKSNSTDFIEAVDFETGENIQIAALSLSPPAWDYHISGNSWAMPGWVLLSEDSHDANAHYLNRQIVAVEIAPAERARVIHLAHHRTRSTEYWTQESHASVNHDFSRVAFHTNWYGGSAEGQNVMMLIELPLGLIR